MATGRFLSKRKAAEWLDVSEKTIDRLRAAGELDAIKVSATQNGRVRISVASLEAYTERRQRKTGAGGPADAFPIPALEQLRARKATPAEAAA